jgi:hypothetical protein
MEFLCPVYFGEKWITRESTVWHVVKSIHIVLDVMVIIKHLG